MIEYTKLPYNKTTIRDVKLPPGNGNKGNCCFLFSPDFDSSISMMVNPKNCTSMGRYRLYFRQLKYIGKTTNNKRYRINDVRNYEALKDKLRTDAPMIKPYPVKLGINPSETRNIFVDLFQWVKIYQSATGSSTSIARNVKAFWYLMRSVIGSVNPKYQDGEENHDAAE